MFDLFFNAVYDLVGKSPGHELLPLGQNRFHCADFVAFESTLPFFKYNKSVHVHISRGRGNDPWRPEKIEIRQTVPNETALLV